MRLISSVLRSEIHIYCAVATNISFNVGFVSILHCCAKPCLEFWIISCSKGFEGLFKRFSIISVFFGILVKKI